MWEISPKQADFLQAKARIVLFLAGIRSGKTRGLCMRAIMSALKHRTFLLVSFSYPSLRDVVMPILKELCIDMAAKFPQIRYKINETSMTVDVIRNNKATKILLRTGSEPDSLRGISTTDAGIDEGREFPNRYIVDILLGRMSDQPDGQLFISSTPKGHNWLDEISKDTKLCQIIRQSTIDNPFLSTEYVEMLLQQYTTQFASQEIYGNIIEFSGGILKSQWFRPIDYVKPLGHAVRFWDVAVSTKTSADFSASCLMSISDGKIIIHDVQQAKLEYPDLRRLIQNTAIADGPNVVIGIESAGQQLGFIDDLSRDQVLGNYSIRAEKPRGDKLNRCLPWASRAELGHIAVCRGPWNKTFFDECDAFTADDSHEHDDEIDSVSGSYSMLQGSTDSLITTSLELDKERIESVYNNETNTGMLESFGIRQPQIGVPVESLF
jgi:predicted phage terminase large subunit-like protein